MLAALPAPHLLDQRVLGCVLWLAEETAGRGVRLPHMAPTLAAWLVWPRSAFAAAYFSFLEYLPAWSLSALPAVKRGCRVAGLALKVAGWPVNGLTPLRALVASL